MTFSPKLSWDLKTLIARGKETVVAPWPPSPV